MFSQSMADAPAEMAFSIKECPSTWVPDMATKRQPFSIKRESKMMLVTAISVNPDTDFNLIPYKTSLKTMFKKNIFEVKIICFFGKMGENLQKCCTMY
jgi:hypothetical protein